MLRLKIEIFCNGCGKQFKEDLFPSAGHAREATHSEGWKTHSVYNTIQDFCPDCQRDTDAKETVVPRTDDSMAARA